MVISPTSRLSARDAYRKAIDLSSEGNESPSSGESSPDSFFDATEEDDGTIAQRAPQDDVTSLLNPPTVVQGPTVSMLSPLTRCQQMAGSASILAGESTIADQIRPNIIKDNPIGNSLDGFRASFYSICDGPGPTMSTLSPLTQVPADGQELEYFVDNYSSDILNSLFVGSTIADLGEMEDETGFGSSQGSSSGDLGVEGEMEDHVQDIGEGNLSGDRGAL